ncbi:ubiquitin fusion protein [Dunaliella salina]|uniref:Ubiquitin fusion protein n=1 Tax=Dunaliella salina TaxID=3046 RepID=A0ABQ7H725_DUNSA|nr:ubiquitin fusion protein [Dunaliella salina]|eukprot:KAF5842656.1 ubiquitin fusion protein [Dunaliella salina]
MSQHVQLFLRGLRGNTQTLWASPDQSVLELKGCVEEKEGIPWHTQGLLHQGRHLQDEQLLSSYGIAAESTVHLVLALRGGKGGFGALLRGLGRDGKGTTNFDACRDLSGRRVRHSTIENKLKEWKASAPERELEKLAEQHIKEMARQQRREEAEQVDIEPLLQEHDKTIEESRRAVQEAIAGGHHQASTSRGLTKGQQGEGAAAAAEGVVGKRQRQEQPGAGGNSSDSSTSSGSSEQQGKRPASAAPPSKKPKMLAMLEDVGVSSDDESSDEEGTTQV